MGGPLVEAMTGFPQDQPDLPFWAVSVMQWIGMVNVMQNASGKLGSTYRNMVKMALETGEMHAFTNAKTGRQNFLSGPTAIYAIYQMFCLAMEAEANK